MVNRMRPGADRALKDGRRRGLYTDCAAASNRDLFSLATTACLSKYFARGKVLDNSGTNPVAKPQAFNPFSRQMRIARPTRKIPEVSMPAPTACATLTDLVRRSALIAMVTSAIARRSMTPVTRRMAVNAAQQ